MVGMTSTKYIIIVPAIKPERVAENRVAFS
jgi:hypothetical protein